MLNHTTEDSAVAARCISQVTDPLIAAMVVPLRDGVAAPASTRCGAGGLYPHVAAHPVYPHPGGACQHGRGPIATGRGGAAAQLAEQLVGGAPG
ncbi:MAG: hypothetical protein IPF55_11735 [Rhodoferax sp.]|nr:hypothetical protein [Rhodoferax sp.]